MILTIPYQAFEACHVHLTPFQFDRYGKSIARLSYKDHSIDFQDLSILSPPLRVIDYNPENSRLRLDLSDYHTFHIKLKTLSLNNTKLFTTYITQGVRNFILRISKFLLGDLS